jgi:hypothetical protein
LNRTYGVKECAEMQVERMKVAPDAVAYADGEQHKLIVELGVPGARPESIDVSNDPAIGDRLRGAVASRRGTFVDPR